MKRIDKWACSGVLMILAWAPVAANAQAKGGATAPKPAGPTTFPGGVQATPWFSSPTVRQQFNLNDAQYNRLNNAHQNAWNQYQKGLAGLDQNLSDADRQQRIRDLEQNYHKDFGINANSILTDPQQLQKYNQLNWQYRGYGAFEDPTVAEKLKLTPEQREKFTQYRQDWSKQMNDLGSIYYNDKDQGGKRFSTLQNQMNDRINSVLTPEQQKTWRQMAGESYSFQPNAYFPANSQGSDGKK